MHLHDAIAAHTFSRLDDPRIEHFRLDDLLGEDVGPRLIADLQLIFQPLRNDQQRAFAFALQQRVGGDRGAHLDGFDRVGRDRSAGRDAQELPDAFERCVVINAGVLRQHFAREYLTGWCARNDVRECAAAIDPEIPFARARFRRLGCHGMILTAENIVNVSQKFAHLTKNVNNILTNYQ